MDKVLIIGLFLFVGCINKPKGQFMNNPSRPLSEIKKDIFEKGDLEAYTELSNYYMDNDSEIEMLPYALILSNKFKNPYGAFLVYECFLRYFKKDGDIEGSLDFLDEHTRTFALEYLKRATDGGEWQAQGALGYYYMEGMYFPKDTVKGRMLLKLAKNGEDEFIESMKGQQ